MATLSERMIEHIRDSDYEYQEMYRASQIDPADGLDICNNCRRDSDNHDEDCKTGIVEIWIEENSNMIDNLAETKS